MMRDRGVVKELLARAEAAGCTKLAFTVDLAITGMRHRDLRNGALSSSFAAKAVKAFEIARHPHWLFDVAIGGKPHGFGNLSTRCPIPTVSKPFYRLGGQPVRFFRHLEGYRMAVQRLEGQSHHPGAFWKPRMRAPPRRWRRRRDRFQPRRPTTRRRGVIRFQLPEVAEAVGSRMDGFMDGGAAASTCSLALGAGVIGGVGLRWQARREGRARPAGDACGRNCAWRWRCRASIASGHRTGRTRRTALSVEKIKQMGKHDLFDRRVRPRTGQYGVAVSTYSPRVGATVPLVVPEPRRGGSRASSVPTFRQMAADLVATGASAEGSCANWK